MALQSRLGGWMGDSAPSSCRALGPSHPVILPVSWGNLAEGLSPP